MTPIQVGDEVRVFVRNPFVNDRNHSYEGVVAKVGRKYATATYERLYRDYHAEPQKVAAMVEFDITTGIEKGTQFGTGIRVLTPAQVAREARFGEVSRFLRERGIELSSRHEFTLEQIEALAEVAKTFTEESR